MTIKSKDLGLMSKADRYAVLDQAAEVSSSTTRNAVIEIERRLKNYEQVHGFSTSDLRQGLKLGTISESVEICDWLFWADIRDRVAAPRPQ